MAAPRATAAGSARRQTARYTVSGSISPDKNPVIDNYPTIPLS